VEIPKEALPVVEVLRREVPRPKDLPKPVSCGHDDPRTCLRWLGKNNIHVEPMGLHPKAKTGTPTCPENFDGKTPEKAMVAFYRWWDGLTEPQAVVALDEIWPGDDADEDPD
jgi:hypothetical protein